MREAERMREMGNEGEDEEGRQRVSERVDYEKGRREREREKGGERMK